MVKILFVVKVVQIALLLQANVRIEHTLTVQFQNLGWASERVPIKLTIGNKLAFSIFTAWRRNSTASIADASETFALKIAFPKRKSLVAWSRASRICIDGR